MGQYGEEGWEGRGMRNQSAGMCARVQPGAAIPSLQAAQAARPAVPPLAGKQQGNQVLHEKQYPHLQVGFHPFIHDPLLHLSKAIGPEEGLCRGRRGKERWLGDRASGRKQSFRAQVHLAAARVAHRNVLWPADVAMILSKHSSMRGQTAHRMRAQTQ